MLICHVQGNDLQQARRIRDLVQQLSETAGLTIDIYVGKPYEVNKSSEIATDDVGEGENPRQMQGRMGGIGGWDGPPPSAFAAKTPWRSVLRPLAEW